MNPRKGIIGKIWGGVQHYNPSKYWRRRSAVIDSESRVPKLVRLYYLYYVKRCDAFNCASMGTNLGEGAFFAEPPIMPHGLNGIIISYYAKIGRGCQIMQQVTIAQADDNTSATIGDNVFIGAGAKIIGNVTIGNNVKIGANAVVVSDVPSNCTVVGVPAKVVKTHG